ncbi:unnamed protein product [Anisakis simplex]|uniref:Ovule protein n=1 Tax=Anisakis simplex TaxID=6269 RepID=A0A0M3JFB6_ANISI|nr:unnamed protein product [Anisakis simplex]
MDSISRNLDSLISTEQIESEPPPSYQAAMAYPANASTFPSMWDSSNAHPKPNEGGAVPPGYTSYPPYNQQFPAPPPPIAGEQ